MRPFFTFSLIICVVLAPWLKAEDAAQNLESYLREAIIANPELSAQFHRVKASRKIGIQVGALPDPKLSYTEFVSSVETRTGPQERAVSLTQAFPWPGKLTLREGIADQTAETAFYRFEATQRQVIREIGLSYFDYAFLGEATRVTKQNLNLLKQLAPTVDEKVRGGGDLGASLRMEVELTKTEDQLQTLEEQRNALSSRLASLLGRTPNLEAVIPFPTLEAGVPQIGSTDSLESGVKAHPLVEAAASGVITAELAEQLSRKSPLPDINIGANVIDIGASGDTAVGVMVGVSIPLNFDKYRAEREEKAELASAARADVESIRQKLLADLHRAIQSWNEADKRLHLYRDKLLPAAEQALEVTNESYRNDKASITDLIDSERTLLDLRLMYQRALASAHKAALEIRTLTEPLSISKK
ncbi:TolC family protein [Verrucomicrobiales bacterium BCK34]|nr:TolC family protein [Verrucomicrobiales bacterium BCK34]